jgi:hypothetical protein
MRVMAGEPAAKDLLAYYWPIAGVRDRKLLGYACGFDTDEKWVEIFIPRLRSDHEDPLMGGRFMTADGQLLKARLYINFDIVRKSDNVTIHCVRQ